MVGGNVIAGVVSSNSVAWEERRNAALRSLLRNLLDLPIAMHFLSFDWTNQLPHGYFGALGVASSLISMYDLWPSVVVAPMKKVV